MGAFLLVGKIRVVYHFNIIYNELSTTKEVIMTSIERHNLQIRMEKALHTKLKEVAESEHRSLSAQIHVMLSNALDEYDRKQQA